MNGTANYPDGLDERAVSQVEREVSREIAALAAPTSGLLDGSARERRNRRILARALRGITAQHGVTLAQAVAELEQPLRPVPVVSTIPKPAAGRRVVRAEAA